MMDILGTGLSGLVGSRIVELLSPRHTFTDASLATGVDITRAADIARIIRSSPAPWVFHLAAYTNVDVAETQRAQGTASDAWKVNVEATETIVSEVQKSGKRLLYLSTDYVFDGTKDEYTEKDTPNPQGWYAITKYEGEKRVEMLGARGLIVRIANPYRAVFPERLDFVRKIQERLKIEENVVTPSDQRFIPTFIDDIATALDVLVKQEVSGVFHVVGSQALSPYEAACRVASIFGYPPHLVQETTFASYFNGRAPRPFSAVLKNDTIAKLGVVMSTFDDGLAIMKSQQTL